MALRHLPGRRFLAVAGHDLIVNCAVAPPESRQLSSGWCVEAWINRYQTLAAGALAFGGALLTVFRISAHIKQVSDLESDRRERKEIAARAKLLMALSILSNYSDSYITQLASFHFEGSVIAVPSTFRLPSLPVHAVSTIEKCLEFTRKDRINSVRGVLAWLQIQNARIADESGVRASVIKRDEALFDAVQLKVLTDKLFNYARTREEDAFDRTIQGEDFKRVAFLFDLHESNYPYFHKFIAQTNWSALEEYL